MTPSRAPSKPTAPTQIVRAARIAALAVVTLLETACSETPDLAREHLRRGDAAIAEGRYPKALSAYTHALQLAPSDPEVQRAMMRARVHLIAESSSRIAREAIEDARYEANLLLESDPPRKAVYLTALGNILVREGDVEAAKGKFAEAIQADPGAALPHTALGLVLMAQRETASQAKTEFEAALKLRPGDLRAHVALGQIELASGNVAGATEHLEAALKIADDFEARMALGNARANQQRSADAVTHFRRAVELDPKSAAALVALGQALLTAGEPGEAENALRAALQLRQDLNAEVALGFALARQKKVGAALGVFRQVLSEDPAAAPALYGAGKAYEDLGEKDLAVQHYRRVVALTAEGPDKQALANLMRDAQSRLDALTRDEAAPSASASASASGAPAPRAAPATTSPLPRLAPPR